MPLQRHRAGVVRELTLTLGASSSFTVNSCCSITTVNRMSTTELAADDRDARLFDVSEALYADTKRVRGRRQITEDISALGRLSYSLPHGPAGPMSPTGIPGTTAPDWSVTWPRRLTSPDWASAVAERKHETSTTSTTRLKVSRRLIIPDLHWASCRRFCLAAQH